MVNISWSLQLPFNNDTYHFNVISQNTPRLVQLNPIKLFSVCMQLIKVPHPVRSTTSLLLPLMLVLPIYTGAGCSVPSPVISSMLPSLPDQRILESSLEGTGLGDVTLRLYTVRKLTSLPCGILLLRIFYSPIIFDNVANHLLL